MRNGPSRRLAASYGAPQVAVQIAQQVPPLIPRVVTPLIPPVTSSRLYSQTVVQPGDVVTATTTTEQPYASYYTFPANTLIVGQTVVVKGAGVYSTSTALPPSQRARVRLGGQTIVDTSPQTFPVSLTASRYWFELSFIVRSIGATGTVEASGLLHFATSMIATIPVLAGPTGAVGENGNPVTVDTTIPLPLVLSVTFGTVPVGGTLQAANSSALRQLTVYTLRPAS